MKGRTLKQVVKRTGNPVELAVRTRRDKAKRARARTSERVERKASPRIPSKSKSIADMTKSKRAAKPSPSSKAIVELCLVETRPVGRENAQAESAIAVQELAPRHNIRIVEAEAQKPELAQSVSTFAVVETNPGTVSAPDHGMDCESERLASEESIEDGDADATEELTGVITDIEIPQAVVLQRKTILYWLAETWKWTRKHLASGHTRKRLRVCESVSLGEKRFLAVIEVDGEQFLVGGASSSVATLARLEPSPEFSDVLKRRWAGDPAQA